MPAFRDIPIRQKLTGIIVVTTALALALAGFGIVLLDALLFRASMERDLAALASIVGNNSTAALTFRDPVVATETLSALRARPHMVAACLYGDSEKPFAHYLRDRAGMECPSTPGPAGVKDAAGIVTVTRAILLDTRHIGTLTLIYDTGEVLERTRLYSAIVLAILLASILLALLLSSRLRSMVAVPITRLAQAAASVSASGDYSIRVQKDSGDELGVLVDAFNEMLGHVQTRDLEVQNARNSLQTTLTSIGDAVISTDDAGRIVFANPVARSLLRWPGPDIAGQKIDDVFRIINEYTRRKVDSPVQKVLQEGVIVGLANHTILIARDGTEVPIDDSAAPIRQNGRTVGVVLVFRDISDRRRAQQDSAYLAAIVESSDDAIIGKSPDGIIQTWNSAAERLYGFPADEVIGRPMRELLPVDRQHEESNILERIRSGKAVVHFETVRVRKDGHSMDVSLTISPIRNRSGEIVGISHVARDITDQKRTAEQIRHTQKLESLGVLAGGIAHDFNNLLTGILGNASLALDDLTPASPAREPIEGVIAASERATQLAQQMLAYSGKGRFVLERIDFSSRVRDTLPLIRASISPTVELHLKLDDHLPAVEADPAQIQQLMMNIIINAAEAVPDGTPGTVTISTGLENLAEGDSHGNGGNVGELAPGPYVRFEVVDTGSGMDEETKGRIFDPFFTTKFTGRGLGLAAVLGIVRGHRGSIQVSSRPGMGTTFRVLFPAMDATADAEHLMHETRTQGNGGGLILVVDDEQVVRNMARQALERYGYTVILAEDGARGLDVFRREAEHIECVVLDLTMPVMSGEETLSHMKVVATGVPIILSSGFDEIQALRRFEGKGLAGFLQKPYKPSRLVEVIRQAVSQAQANDPEINPAGNKKNSAGADRA